MSALSGAAGSPAARRHARDHRLDHVDHALPGLGAAAHGIVGRNADDVLDLGDHAVGLGRGQIDLVQHRHHFHALLGGGVAVGHRLRFDPLRRIHHQQRPLAGRQRARHLVGEVDVPGGVDQVEQVGAPVARAVGQRRGLGLDRNPALALQRHGVQYLRLHLAVGEAAAELDEPVSQRGFAVVDVSDDGKVADVLHYEKGHRFVPLPASGKGAILAEVPSARSIRLGRAPVRRDRARPLRPRGEPARSV